MPRRKKMENISLEEQLVTVEQKIKTTEAELKELRLKAKDLRKKIEDKQKDEIFSCLLYTSGRSSVLPESMHRTILCLQIMWKHWKRCSPKT